MILNVNGENCLSTLGLTGVPATEADLKRIYREAIRKAHPDVGGSEEEAARLNAAYDLALNLFFTKPKETKATRADTGLRPQLLTPIDEDEAVKYIIDDLWCAQEKKDGKHILVKRNPKRDEISDGVIAANKQGLETALPHAVELAVKASFDVILTLDGELIGNKLYVFDLLDYDGVDYRKESYQTRYAKLRSILIPADNHLVLVPAYFTTKDKTVFFDEMKKLGKEGVVFKRLDTLFSEGRPESGGNMVKCKFWASVSAIVDEQETGKSSFVSYVLDAKTGERVSLGHCSALGKVMPQVGDIVEIKYLYAYKGGKLIQQSLLGIRDDVLPEECTTKQLKFKAEN